MKKITLFLFLAVLTQVVHAQTPTWLWAVSATGGDNFQYGSGAAIDDSGFFYMGGRFAPGITFGSHSLNTAAPATQFFGKFDENGNCLWLAQQFYSNGYDYPRGFCIDKAKNNNVYATGLVSSGSSMYVVKFNNDGIFQWSTTLGAGSGYTTAPNADGIAADTSGNVYVTGQTGGGGGSNWTFGDSILNYAGTSSSQEMFLTKLDNTGHILWAVGMDGFDAADDGYDVGRSVTLDKTGQYVFVGGGYYGTPTFHSRNSAGDITPPPQSGPNSTLFIAKYDSGGNLLFVTTALGAGIPWTGSTFTSSVGASNSIATDSCDDIFVTGTYSGSATFGTFVLTAAGTNDGFVASCNNKGEWQWVDDIASTGSSSGASIALDKDNDVYVGGAIAGTANFGSGVTASSSAASDAFIAKYANSNGAAQWVLTPTGSGASGGGSVAIDNQKFVYFTGSYSGTMSLGGNTITYGGGFGQGIYIAKLDTVPARYIVPVVDSTYCPGSTVTLTYSTIGTFNPGNVFTAELSNDSGSFINYTVIGDTTLDTTGTITITIPSNTTPGSNYLIRVVSSNPVTSSYVNGCGAYYQPNVYIDNFYVTIGGSSSLSILATPDTVCSGGTVKLKASGGSSYLWSTGATTDSITLNPTTDTTIFLTSTGGCNGNDSIKVTVNSVLPLTITPPSPVIECIGQSIMLVADTTGSGYTWSPATGLESTTGNTVTANPTVNVTYTITGMDSLGCTVTAQEIINVQTGPNKPTITISANGDTLISSAKNGNQWYVNGQPIAGAVDSTYIIVGLPKGDTVTVSVTDVANGCSTTSDSVILSGINPLSIAGNQLSIYPNPTNGTVNVTISSSATGIKDWNLQLVDVLGQTVYSRKALNYNNEIDLSNLPGGVYFITIENKTAKAVFPLVKQN